MKTKTIKLVSLLVLGLSLNGLKAQDIITASAVDVSKTTITANYNDGQAARTGISYYNGPVNRAVQEAYEFNVVGIDINPEISLELLVYPNFSSAKLSIEGKYFDALSYQLFDARGNLLLDQKVEMSLTSISMQHWENSTYFLRVNFMNSELKAFKIIKTQ